MKGGEQAFQATKTACLKDRKLKRVVPWSKLRGLQCDWSRQTEGWVTREEGGKVGSGQKVLDLRNCAKEMTHKSSPSGTPGSFPLNTPTPSQCP